MKNHSNVNFWWIIGVLVVLLIAVMTLYLSNYMIEYEKFVDQLSFL